MAQVVLRKPACQRVAKSNSPSTTITEEERLTASHATRPPLERGNKWCGKAAPILRPYRLTICHGVAMGRSHAGKRRHGPGCRSNQCRAATPTNSRSEEHTSELQSPMY